MRSPWEGAGGRGANGVKPAATGVFSLACPLVNCAYLLTPPGSSAIAVVRAVGPAVAAFLADHFTGNPRVGRASHGELRDGDRVIDDPVVVLVGPDAADLNLHGGPWVVRATLDLLARAGFDVSHSLALPLPADVVDVQSPPTPVAPRPGLVDADINAANAVEQDVLAHLPLARTELGVRTLLAQPAAWGAFLTSAPSAACVAAVLADRTMGRLLHPARVAIVGAANVGKSTLANRLFGRERSITADLPGTTRDWVGELADLDGVPVTLVDTPGLRATDDPIERAAIAGARGQVESADVVVVVVDAARPMDDEQRRPLADWPGAIVVVNKVDRAAAWDAAALPAAAGTGGREMVSVVATTGVGVAALRRAIVERLGCSIGTADFVKPRIWTSRQMEWLSPNAAVNPSGNVAPASDVGRRPPSPPGRGRG